jgi:hypothetical protein
MGGACGSSGDNKWRKKSSGISDGRARDAVAEGGTASTSRSRGKDD